jgi:hypothetical protein
MIRGFSDCKEAVMRYSSIGSKKAALAILLILVATVAVAAEATGVPNAQESDASVNAPVPAPLPRSVLEESFQYHHQGELPEKAPYPTVAPARGWYRYGFPVQTHRWGWFGAEHYYPRVLWHYGYYGDHYRWSYRRGY